MPVVNIYTVRSAERSMMISTKKIHQPLGVTAVAQLDLLPQTPSSQ